MRLDFHLHFILTWFENTSDNIYKTLIGQKGHHGCQR